MGAGTLGGGLPAVLGLAFGLGLLHALDADHVMAVTGLAAGRPGLRRTLRFCARWAVGHGLALGGIGAAVLIAGLAVPEALSARAEGLVGLVLVAIGAWVLWDLWQRRAHLHFHRHDRLPRHAHWHRHDAAPASHADDPHRHSHGAVMVGVLHGTAGSAPLLALLPMAQLGSAWAGMAYLALFGLGVLTTMLVFGGLLGGLWRGLARWGDRALRLARGGVGLGACVYGGHLLAGVAG